MDENADASQAIFIFISRELEATTGVAAHNLDEEHSRWPVHWILGCIWGWRSGTKSASLETDVIAQHYTFVLVHATTALVHMSTGRVAALLLRMTELRFYISPNTKQVISEMFFRDKTNKKTQLKQTCTHNKIFYNTKLTHKK